MNNNKITKEKIMSLYSDYLLKNNEQPKNIYVFATDNHFEEQEFYHYFTSFEQIEKNILSHFFLKSIQLTTQIHGFEEMNTKEKLLNTYFIFFENLTMNRSLVLHIIDKMSTSNMLKFNLLRSEHQSFVKNLNFETVELFKNSKEDFKKLSEKTRAESLWIHFLTIIEFWKKDSSPNFEKTDVFIEKTIDTGFEFIDPKPINKLLDLGKFLWKEKFANS